MKTEQLRKDLAANSSSIAEQVAAWQKLDLPALNFRTNTASWNLLECLEHLNLYGDFYLPEICNAIKSSNTHPAEDFKSGWLGGYFAKSMLPKAKLNKMKTFKDKNPIQQNLDKSVLDKFLHQQAELQALIVAAKDVNWQSTRVKTSISPLVRLRLGDTFQFYINHIVRHLQQAERALVDYEKSIGNSR